MQKAILHAGVRVLGAHAHPTGHALLELVRGEDGARLEGALLSMSLTNETMRAVGAPEVL
jgi:hypothetical protein